MATVRQIDQVLGAQEKATVRPAQFAATWMTAIVAGGMDGTHTLQPDTITLTDVNMIDVGGHGTIAKLRFAYDQTCTASTADPVIQVFGRCGGDNTDNTDSSAESWMALKNNANAQDITMVTAPTTDTNDGTYKRTVVDNDDHLVDLKGCSQIMVLVKTAWNGTNGNNALAFLEVGIF